MTPKSSALDPAVTNGLGVFAIRSVVKVSADRLALFSTPSGSAGWIQYWPHAIWCTVSPAVHSLSQRLCDRGFLVAQDVYTQQAPAAVLGDERNKSGGVFYGLAVSEVAVVLYPDGNIE